MVGRLLPLPFLSASAWEGGASGLGGERKRTATCATLLDKRHDTYTVHVHTFSPTLTFLPGPGRFAVRLDVRLNSYHTFSSYMYAWSYALLLLSLK